VQGSLAGVCHRRDILKRSVGISPKKSDRFNSFHCLYRSLHCGLRSKLYRPFVLLVLFVFDRAALGLGRAVLLRFVHSSAMRGMLTERSSCAGRLRATRCEGDIACEFSWNSGQRCLGAFYARLSLAKQAGDSEPRVERQAFELQKLIVDDRVGG
jgi:hypothetical protein